MTSAGPLDGITVIDLTRALAGPHAGMMLGDMGARVIKVESPGKGDDTRGWGPPFVGPNHDIATYYLSCNRNKESITLDLKSDDGKEVLTKLIGKSDVLLENFRTGVLDRLGFSMEQIHRINPRMVVMSITGFGHDGPQAGRAGYDQIAQGEGGLMSMTGPDPETPSKVGVPIADLLSGMYGAYGVVSALYERERTGRGKVVRTSLLASIIGVHAFQGTRWTVGKDLPKAEGAFHPSVSPYGLFSSKDGMLQIAVGAESQWQKFAPAFGFDPEDPTYATNGDRVRNNNLLIPAINHAFAQYRNDELLEKLNALGIPCGEVKNLEQVYAWDQVRSQGLVVDVDHPVLGRIELPGPPVRMFDGDTEWTREHTSPPALGADNDAVRAWLEE
ncbi:CaiB/BaiF CoA transferase family protein [Cumulibacter manganitolerans]|uniref:CaiB/BaiF CoA transferase family protein n=1 Tax=Cumulibacter manganitolerans TaxID=1884992 RepID=UPI001294DD80|nr:CoA transferase [Cumulibacter manganitolerans]